MAKSLFKIFLFLLPLFILFQFSENILSGQPVFSFNKPSFGKESVVEDADLTAAKVAVFGSSHASYNVDAKQLNYKTINFGYNSQSLYYDYQIFKKHLPQMPNLKVVLVTISYFSLEYNITKSRYSWNQFHYEKAGYPLQDKKLYLDFKRYSLFAFNGRDPSVEFLFSEAWKYASQIISNLKLAFTSPALASTPIDNLQSEVNQPLSNASPPVASSPGVLKINANNRIDLHHSMMHQEDLPENIKILEDLITLAKERGIEVVFITHPVFDSYSQLIKEEKYQTMQTEIKKLQQKYGLDYYNYFYDKRFNAWDFSDQDHLDYPGINKLAKIINEEILSSRSAKLK